jgi:hypothetical protein
MNTFSYMQAEETIAGLRYENHRMIERLKELADMYRSGGFHEAYLVLLFAASILEAEKDKRP